MRPRRTTAGAFLLTVAGPQGPRLYYTYGYTDSSSLSLPDEPMRGPAPHALHGEHPAISSLITHYYVSLLGRSPDDADFTFWQSEIAHIQSQGIDVREGFIALARVFLTSPEYLAKGTTDAAYITDLDETFFNRTPLASEVTYWTNLMHDGMSRDITMNWFVYSSEYAAYMTGVLGSSVTRLENNLVNDLYRGFLNRLPDTAGFATQLTAMRTAQASDAAAVRSTTLAIALNFLGARVPPPFPYQHPVHRGLLQRHPPSWRPCC
jgi:hypothetical protein